MEFEHVLLVACIAYLLSAIVRYMVAANDLSLQKKQKQEQEIRQKRKIDSLYGRGD